jgi:hypothetical protein
LQILDEFVKWTETRGAVMIDDLPSIQRTLDELRWLETPVKPNEDAALFIKAIQARFISTPLLCSHTLTPEGRQWHGHLLATHSSTLSLPPEHVTDLIRGALSRLQGLIGADEFVLLKPWMISSTDPRLSATIGGRSPPVARQLARDIVHSSLSGRWHAC